MYVGKIIRVLVRVFIIGEGMHCLLSSLNDCFLPAAWSERWSGT